MCASILMMLSLKLAQFQQTTLSKLPPKDAQGRYSLLNKHGKTSPDQNGLTLGFLYWSVNQTYAWEETTKNNLKHPLKGNPPFYLEVGAGFGFLGAHLLANRAYYYYNDKDRRHFKIALNEIFPTSGTRDSAYEEVIGAFPSRHVIQKIKKSKRRIAGIGSFMVLHFLRPAEISKFLDASWNLLEPGGLLWLTAGTPYNKLFKEFPTDIYPERKENFLKDPVNNPFPGEIEDAHAAGYLDSNYPKYFHALDIDILKILVEKNKKKSWKILNAVNIERPLLTDQAYTQGYEKGQTELVGIILQKQ